MSKKSITIAPLVSGTGIHMYLVAARWRAAVDGAYRQADVSPLQFNVLIAIQALQKHDGSAKQVHIARYAGVDVMTLSKNVRALEDAGLVRRLEDPHDSRARIVELTREGTNRVKQLEKALGKLDKQIFAVSKGIASFEKVLSGVFDQTN